MLVQRKNPTSNAVQYKLGVESSLIKINKEDGLAYANYHIANIFNPRWEVEEDEWVVATPGEVVHQVFTDGEFKRKYEACTTRSDISPLHRVAAAALVIDEEYLNSTEAEGTHSPVHILIAGLSHTGKTLIASVLEASLKTVGFTNVQFARSEEPMHLREEMVTRLVRSKADNEFQDPKFFDKAITFHQVVAPRSKNAREKPSVRGLLRDLPSTFVE